MSKTEDLKYQIKLLKQELQIVKNVSESQIEKFRNDIEEKNIAIEKIQNDLLIIKNKMDQNINNSIENSTFRKTIKILPEEPSEKDLSEWYNSIRQSFRANGEVEISPSEYSKILATISEGMKTAWRIQLPAFLLQDSTPKSLKDKGEDFSKWNHFEDLITFMALLYKDISKGLTTAPTTAISDPLAYKAELINGIIKSINDFNLNEDKAFNKLSTTLTNLSKRHDNIEKSPSFIPIYYGIVDMLMERFSIMEKTHSSQEYKTKNPHMWITVFTELNLWINSENYRNIKITNRINDFAPDGFIPLEKFLQKLLTIFQITANEIAKSKLLLDSMRNNLKETNAKFATNPSSEKNNLPFSKKRVRDISHKDSSTTPCNHCNNLHGKDAGNFCKYFSHVDTNRDKAKKFPDTDIGKIYAKLNQPRISANLKLNETKDKMVDYTGYTPGNKKKSGEGEQPSITLNLNTIQNNPLLLPIFMYSSNKEDKEVIFNTLIDTGAINGNFISVEAANKLINLGAEKHYESIPVKSGLKDVNTSKTLGFLACIELSYFSCKDNKNIKITLNKVFIIETNYDLIIGRKANCQYDFTDKLKPILCKDVNTQHESCINKENCRCEASNKEENLLNIIEDIQNLTPSGGSISYEELLNRSEPHSYNEEEALEVLNLIETEWAEINKKAQMVSDIELNNINFEHTYSNPKQKRDIEIQPLEGVKPGDRLKKEDIFKKWKSDLSNQNINDLKKSGADSEEFNIELNNIQSEEDKKASQIINNTKRILEAIEFCGDEAFNEKLRELCKEYIDIFAFDLSQCEVADIEPLKIDINLEKWEKNTNKGKPRQMSDSKRQIVKEEIEKKVRAGIMSSSTANYWSQIHMVNKTIDTYRMCMDFRLLNECINSSTWPMPTIQETFQDIGRAKPKYYACLDFAEGYFQLALHILSRYLTATLSHYGLFEWNRVPMGLKTSAAWFQRKMETEVLQDQVNKICKVYQDDVLIYAQTQSELLSHIREVFQRCRVKKVKVKPSKLKLGGQEVQHLGHQISEKGVTFSREKLQGVFNFERPKNIKSLQRFLGLINWFSTHVKHKALLVRPLYELLKEFKTSKKLEWTEKAIAAFEEIKKKIWEIPTLFFIDRDKPIFLQTDASDYGISGYVFQQEEDGKEIIVGLYSKALVNHELNWSPFEKEAFAIFMSIRKFHYLLADVKFTVKTDHRNLLFMNNDASNKVINWKMQILPFDFDIIHVPGKINIIPDVGSRAVARRDGKTEDTRRLKSLEKIIEDQINEMEKANGSNSKSLSSLSVHEFEPTIGVEKEFTSEESLASLFCNYIYADYADQNEGEETIETPVLNSIEINKSVDRYREEIEKSKSLEMQAMSKNTDVELNSVRLGTLPLRSAKENFTCKVLDNDRFDLIKKYHNDKKGHLQLWPTVRKMLENETEQHNNLARDVKYFIEQCPICQLRKEVKVKFQTKPFNISVFGPMERISIDSIGPLPPDEKGNRYIIVFIDIFSRFITLYSVDEITSSTTRNCILAHAGAFGTATQYCVDRGRQYDNISIDEVIKYLGSQELKTRGGSHQENGIIERANKEIIKHLTAIIHEGYIREKWSSYTPLVARIMNAIPNNSTGIAPAKIIFGINSVNLDRELLVSEIKKDRDISMSDFIKDLIKAQKVIINKALYFQDKVNENYIEKKKKEMLQRSSYKFEPNSFVTLAYETGKAPNKLLFKNSGPYRVIRRIGDNLELQNLIDEKITFHHVNLTKPFVYDPNRVDPIEISRKTAAEGAEYIVKDILDHGLIDDFNNKDIKKAKKENIVFLIKWSIGEPSLEPWKVMLNTTKLKEYLEKQGLKNMIPKEKHNSSSPKRKIDELESNESMEEELREKITSKNLEKQIMYSNEEEKDNEPNNTKRKRKINSKFIQKIQKGKFYINDE